MKNARRREQGAPCVPGQCSRCSRSLEDPSGERERGRKEEEGTVSNSMPILPYGCQFKTFVCRLTGAVLGGHFELVAAVVWKGRLDFQRATPVGDFGQRPKGENCGDGERKR